LILGRGDRHLDCDISCAVSDGRGSHRDYGILDSKFVEHVIGYSSRLSCRSTGNNDGASGFVRDIFSVLTQHAQTEEFDSSEDQHEENGQHDRHFHYSRATRPILLRRSSKIMKMGSKQGITPSALSAGFE
jgi:hypothetical protein